MTTIYIDLETIPTQSPETQAVIAKSVKPPTQMKKAAEYELVGPGHNNPPQPTPYELSAQEITDLYAEAKLWLDGEKVTTQEQADALNTLADRIRKAGKLADDRRVEEAKPFDYGKKEVQARYKPIIEQADKAVDAVKAALKPYLLELERQQQEKARIAREEAEAARAAAMKAMQERDAANLEQAEAAEALVRASKQADLDAIKADNAKAHAKGEGRAAHLRTVWRAKMTDPHKAAAWVWKERNAELVAFVQDLADKAVRSGVRSIPGFEIIDEKVL